jgi:hypothetical protein
VIRKRLGRVGGELVRTELQTIGSASPHLLMIIAAVNIFVGFLRAVTVSLP